uniref:RRM domain-containing protein n=1 Tax=Globodera rostochiensis TaxID=31243 RepID=A0A914GZ64_GLORO
MRGPRGKGFAEMAVTRVASCGFETPMSENGFEMGVGGRFDFNLNRRVSDIGTESIGGDRLFSRLLYGGGRRRGATTPGGPPPSVTPMAYYGGQRNASRWFSGESAAGSEAEATGADSQSLAEGLHTPGSWSMRGGIGKALQLLRDRNEGGGEKLNALLTYITLPWTSILEDILAPNTRKPILTFEAVKAMPSPPASSELIPFFTHNDLYLRPIHRVTVEVTLPKLRQMGQSVSNWEIRERLKKMLHPIELSDFKVHESTLEEVHFIATVGSDRDIRTTISLLHGTSFRAIGFTDPLAVKAREAKLDFPTRVDWDQFFDSADGGRQMDEKEPGERPDTVYVGGLPFEWFQTSVDETVERTFWRIFSEFGEVACVDIPQCDPLRKMMELEISGIQLSSWLFGQDPFFEVYVQFREYDGFVSAMAVLGGKMLVQKCANGALREAKIKVDFDRSAHLSIRKITQRRLRRICIEYERGKTEEKAQAEEKRLEEMMREERERREREGREAMMRRLLRAERRQRLREQCNFEHILRRKLKGKLNHRLESSWKTRQRQAKALLQYVAELYKVQQQLARESELSIHELASEYARERGLPDEEELRRRILSKKEQKMRTQISVRILQKNL